ncbi:MAG: S8 family serine peptidase, partial [Cyclobacteriaceae bacterium]
FRSVTGTLIASGVNSNARGMAPKASVTNWYFNNDIAEMTALAKLDQTSLLLSNHSYGTVTGWTKVNGEWSWSGNASVSGDEDYRFGFYGSKAQALDQLANLAPYYTIVWAAGNDRGEPGDGSRPPDCNGGTGYDCIIPESVAKNIITVGAINKLPMYSNPASVVMSNFSSWGPTDDGRIKPDLVGAGVNLFSLLADGTDSYGFSSGTSMSTPNVTGSLTLLQELYNKLHGGKFMKSATLKALAIQTAKEAGILPGPDYSFGWGLLDVEAAAKLLTAEDGVNSFIREENLVEGSTYELILNPKANQKITITMAWNDPASEPIAPALDPLNLMLVNDLDIKLVAENGAISYPWLLDPSTPSAQAIRGDNYRDNVEKLEFNLPEAKPYRLVVSHKG